MNIVTADDIKNDLKTLNACEGIDEWITTVVRPKFIQNGGLWINIDTQTINAKKWTQIAFETAMIKRGFKIQLICDDRPCAYPYYRIDL